MFVMSRFLRSNRHPRIHLLRDPQDLRASYWFSVQMWISRNRQRLEMYPNGASIYPSQLIFLHLERNIHIRPPSNIDPFFPLYFWTSEFYQNISSTKHYSSRSHFLRLQSNLQHSLDPSWLNLKCQLFYALKKRWSMVRHLARINLKTLLSGFILVSLCGEIKVILVTQ